MNAPPVPKVGSKVWLQRPYLADTDPVSQNRQRSLILRYGFGPFLVEEVRAVALGGTIVVITVLSGTKEVPAARLVSESPATFREDQPVVWADSTSLDTNSRDQLYKHKKQYGPGPFKVKSSVPAHPYDAGSDLLELDMNGDGCCLESKFFALA